MTLTDVRFKAADANALQTGLLGWLTFSIGPLQVDGVTLRRTADGRTTLSFPARRDRAGRQHFYVRPLNDDARRVIEHQVLRALGLEEIPA